MSECVHMCMQVNMLMHMWGPEEVDSSKLTEVTGICGTQGFLRVCQDLISGPQDSTGNILSFNF